jgi:SAM domain (Sterile alpha motif)
MDVASWLRSLGLERYEPVFRENEIDADVLPELTELDLEKLGVPLGHRKRLLKAIATLCSDAKVQASSAAAALARPSAAEPTSAPVAETVGERRHVTVMFCDLVGSTSISAALDAEDWRDLVGAYLEAASAAVAEMRPRCEKTRGRVDVPVRLSGRARERFPARGAGGAVDPTRAGRARKGRFAASQ